MAIETLLFFADQLETPIGTMRIVADTGQRLRLAFFAEDDRPVLRELSRYYGAKGFVLQPAAKPLAATAALASYFKGDLDVIDDIPVETAGTPFQRAVWKALRTIPCGSTLSYGKLAQNIGHPEAVRAVGAANGANPVSVVVPCHRVIGANGALTGYGGGIERKRWLLDHETRPTRLF